MNGPVLAAIKARLTLSSNDPNRLDRAITTNAEGGNLLLKL